MIDIKEFFAELSANGIEFFSGVPDSLLKSFCAYAGKNAKKHIIAQNEGGAVALGAGYHLATGKIPLIYMQNSGIGNAINPLLSLCDELVYALPCLLLIGWRGEPGIKDEPQHIRQGEVTCELLNSSRIHYEILDPDCYKEQLNKAFKYMITKSAPFALVARKGTFSEFKAENSTFFSTALSREKAIEICIKELKNSVFISTTGMASRELFELRESLNQSHTSDFLCVGNMGHASSIALSIANEKKNSHIVCIDGDGATLMHMGAMAIIGSQKPKNLLHIVLNNAAHDSVGAQPTCANKIDLCAIAKACGYDKAICANDEISLQNALNGIKNELTFLEIKVKIGARSDLGRPTTTPAQNKKNFMEFLQKNNW